MKFFVFGYILSFIFTFNVYAETVDYSEIIPGLTLRYEVNELLGSPVEEVITGSVYRYTSNHYAIKYIDVTYIRKTNRVEFYSLYFKKEYYKNDILYLFDLYEPVHKLYGLDGNCIEVYFPESMLVRYMSTGENSSVERVDILGAKLSESFNKASVPNEDILNIYALGVRIVNIRDNGVRILDVTKDGNADIAGLKTGDIILEVGDYIFDQPYNLARFQKTIALMPIDEILYFLVLRAQERSVFKVILTELSHADKEAVLNREYEKARMTKQTQLLPIRSYDSGIYKLNLSPKDPSDVPPFVDVDQICDFDGFKDLLIKKEFVKDKISRLFPDILVEDSTYNVPGHPQFDFSYHSSGDTTFLITGAVLFMKSGFYQQAVENFINILNNDPGHSFANYALGFCYDKLDDIVRAGFYYNKALSYYSDNKKINDYIGSRLVEFKVKS